MVCVDTNKYSHIAVALDQLCGRIEARTFAADRSGYEQLIDWAVCLGREWLIPNCSPTYPQAPITGIPKRGCLLKDGRLP